MIKRSIADHLKIFVFIFNVCRIFERELDAFICGEQCLTCRSSVEGYQDNVPEYHCIRLQFRMCKGQTMQLTEQRNEHYTQNILVLDGVTM